LLRNSRFATIALTAMSNQLVLGRGATTTINSPAQRIIKLSVFESLKLTAHIEEHALTTTNHEWLVFTRVSYYEQN
jgi:hypothetical protein